jgi:hypothetical protein
MSLRNCRLGPAKFVVAPVIRAAALKIIWPGIAGGGVHPKKSHGSAATGSASNAVAIGRLSVLPNRTRLATITSGATSAAPQCAWSVLAGGVMPCAAKPVKTLIADCGKVAGCVLNPDTMS